MSDHKTYRVYSYDEAHQVLTNDLIKATSDAEAIAAAESARFGSRCEIWDGRRMVARLPDQQHTG